MAAKSITHSQGKGSLSHNNRQFSAPNVDSSRTTDNVTFTAIPIKQAYDDCFRAAVERYNARQKRSDRRIKDGYFQYTFARKPCNTVICAADKRKSFYEDIVQIGTKDDTGIGTEDAETAKKCLTEYMSGFAQRNPNFYVFNAVLHMDEATPHLHIDYIPVGHYKRGIDTQNGIAQALKEMGFGEGKDAISRWRQRERVVLEDICKQHDLEISAPHKARGTFAVEEYKQYKDNISELEQERAKKEKELEYVNEKLSKTLNYLPKKSSEDLSDRSDEIISEFNEIKSPIIQKSTAGKYIKAVEKQKNIAINELDKAERAIYSLRKVNSDAQKTNEKLQDDNERLCAENIDLRQELSAARKREKAIQRLGLAAVISAEVDRQAEEEKSRQKERRLSRSEELS